MVNVCASIDGKSKQIIINENNSIFNTFKESKFGFRNIDFKFLRENKNYSLNKEKSKQNKTKLNGTDRDEKSLSNSERERERT